ncbi:hypothetical protein JQ557_33595 [Bradyrhizobium sp. U87765 SZCCT0131]|uniref:hypothetical protein n=1 Tax=unclassified Bradyrhizobium TaxID=2631580 RepID=UPI001BA8B7DF|nr:MULTISPECIES: hypothetical protein [unclassified Bradyrhizobium]MBR1222976.1 hypothetical protein [Bradyrhizobium sp. U87765 SZCCT0131]MBR1262712.1 hypothetical protein [Bradyrhizobium sp. U87765 SZCCT0134]MBR1308816.1 hypothetical protein [Bradyrhizobium sp. U87765 SZCCT0110]MBR1318494.1 hypothetical protein [Bradyrhizobium sp. U87765 SZCCT0109]MBR1352198.1 hypothetical protein [Bradyrhizobium sp. U87765 SZCCT0048]
MLASIGRLLLLLLKGLVVLVALLWLITVGVAESNCSLLPGGAQRCGGGMGDIWVIPIFSAPIGIPAVIGAAVIIISAARRRRPLQGDRSAS